MTDFRDTDFLLLSDVHLGADLVQHTRPWTLPRLGRAADVDRELSSMLEHYRTHVRPDRRWRLVIAGDLIDFVGMSISPLEGAELATPLDADEREHGLGNARDRVVQKMRAVTARHDLVFRALAAFVADGHTLVLVRGNHDVEFYWEEAREAFVRALTDRVEGLAADDAARAAFESRIEFRPWFYYVENLLYVEHGHQYDETCAHHHVLAPLSPRDPGRIGYSFSDILLRYVARPTRGIRVEGHENKGLDDYVRLGLSLGARGAVRLFLRYARAVREMFRAWSDHQGKLVRNIRAMHIRQMRGIARQRGLAVRKLHALAALAATPVTGGAWKILHSVFLDLTLAVAGAVLLLTVLGVFELAHPLALPGVAALLALALALWLRSARVHDPGQALRRGAARVAELMPTQFVVMGHTHEPVMAPIGSGATYVNLGGWADPEGEEGAAPPPPGRTHLVLREVDGALVAELIAWDAASGPRRVAGPLPTTLGAPPDPGPEATRPNSQFPPSF